MAEIKGIAYNGDSVEFVTPNNSIIDGDLIINGNLTIKKNYKNSNYIKIVTFHDGTDEEIAAMLEAHYKGRLNIEDYWAIGDTRQMQLTAMESSEDANEAHAEQIMTMMIIGFNHDTLVAPINGKTKAAVTIQCRELLGNNGVEEAGPLWGGHHVQNTNTDNYANNSRRTWCNNTFINALPINISPLVKTVIKKNLANHTDNTPGPNTEDKAFILSYPEVYGSITYDYYMGNESLEGEQYEYYKAIVINANTHVYKYINNNGEPSVTSESYWYRSPSIYENVRWMRTTKEGYAATANNTHDYNFIPAFCL